MREIELGTDWTIRNNHTLSLTLYAQYTSDAISMMNSFQVMDGLEVSLATLDV